MASVVLRTIDFSYVFSYISDKPDENIRAGF